MTSLTLLTKPDMFTFSSLDKSPLPYTRILGALFESEQVYVRTEAPEAQWSLDVPPYFAKRLLVALKCIKAGEPMNCHRFSRIISDTRASSLAYDDESYAVSDITEKNKVTALALGELGLVGSAAEVNGARHSLIGLGESNPQAIQVMSAQSDLGIARYDDILKFYRGSWPNERLADVFRA